MGQRSQIYIRINGKLVVANYYQWNYGARMISRAKGILEFLEEYREGGYMDFFIKQNIPDYAEQLRRVCDVNFDLRDYQISVDIVKEWREDFPERPFNRYVFDEQDNNDGQLFIDVQGDTIKYGGAMYFLEQRKKFTAPNILGGHSYPVPTYRWKQIAVSEDKRALEKHLERIVKNRVKSDHANECDIRREYKIISNEPPCN